MYPQAIGWTEYVLINDVFLMFCCLLFVTSSVEFLLWSLSVDADGLAAMKFVSRIKIRKLTDRFNDTSSHMNQYFPSQFSDSITMFQVSIFFRHNLHSYGEKFKFIHSIINIIIIFMFLTRDHPNRNMIQHDIPTEQHYPQHFLETQNIKCTICLVNLRLKEEL